MNGINNLYSRFVNNVDRKAIHQVLTTSNSKVKVAAASVIGAFGLLLSSKQSHCSPIKGSNSSDLFEQAKIDAKENSVAFCESMKSNSIFKENERIELAKIAVHEMPQEILPLIDNFRIHNKEVLLKICNDGVKEAAERMFETFYNQFQDSQKKIARTPGGNQEKAQVLITLAEALHETSKEEFVEAELINSPLLSFSFLKKMDLSAQNELGKIVATRYPVHLPKFIFKSDLPSPMQENLIKIAASQENESVSSSIFLYNADEFPPIEKKSSNSIKSSEPFDNPQGRIGTKDQGFVIKAYPNTFYIAKKLMNGQITWVTSLYQKDNLARISVDARIEIAKIAVSQKENSVSSCIKNYRITDEQVLIEIANIALSTDPYGLMSNIHKYGIQDSKALLDLAKKATSKYGELILNFLANFGITDVKEIEELKKIANNRFGSRFF